MPDTSSGRKYEDRLDFMFVLQWSLYFRSEWCVFLAPSTLSLFSPLRALFPTLPVFRYVVFVDLCVCVFPPSVTLYFCSFLFIFVHFLFILFVYF